jgi:integrase
MINRVTCVIAIRKDATNKKGVVPIVARFQINGKRVEIPLSARIEPKYFDENKELVKPSSPEATQLNVLITNARVRTNAILAQSNEKNIRLSRDSFRAKFTSANADADFITFWTQEIELRRSELTHGTYKQQKSSLKKFSEFKSYLPFSMLETSLLHDYERWLLRRGNNNATVSCALKNLKCYINHARVRGYVEQQPFDNFKIKTARGRVDFLTVIELEKLLKLHRSGQLKNGMYQASLLFLVACFTSLRISDITAIERGNIKDGVLIFQPQKTRKSNKTIRVRLSSIAAEILKEFFGYRDKTKIISEQKINQFLKVIAAMIGTNTKLSLHVGRHTFATTFLEIGGAPEVLQEIMGHSRIETTMIYVHVTDKRKDIQMQNFDNHFKLK